MVYDAFVTEEYDHEGVRKARFHKVGIAFEAKKGKGLDLIIPPGVSVSGRVSIRERRAQPDAGAAEDEIPY